MKNKYLKRRPVSKSLKMGELAMQSELKPRINHELYIELVHRCDQEEFIDSSDFSRSLLTTQCSKFVSFAYSLSFGFRNSTKKM